MNRDKSLIILDRFIEIFLLILIFTIPFPRHKQTIETACFFFIILLWIIKSFLQPEAMRMKRSSIDLPILVFTFFIVLSIFFAYNPTYSLEAFRKFWIKPLLLFYIIVNFVDNGEKLRHLIFVLILSFLAPLIMGMIEFSMHSPSSRIVSFFPSPNQYGEYLVNIILLLLGIILWDEKKILRIILSLVIGISLFCLVFTYSRANWICIFVAIVFLCFLKNKKTGLLSIGIMILFLIFSPAPVKEKARSIFNMENLSADSVVVIAKRPHIWKATLTQIKKSPFIGLGFGHKNFKAFYPKLEKENVIQKDYIHVHAHNYYLEIAIELGIIALLVFLWLWIIIIMRSWKNFIFSENPFVKGVSAGILACFISKSIYWLAEVPHDGQIILTLWAFIGITMAIFNITEEKWKRKTL